MVARAYVDQLERDSGLGDNQIEALRGALDAAETALADGRSDAASAGRLSEIATAVEAASEIASGPSRERAAALVEVLRELAERLG